MTASLRLTLAESYSYAFIMHTLHNAPTMMKGLPVSTTIYIKIQQKHKYKCKKAYTKLQNKLFVLENKNQFVQIISSSRTWHCPLYRKRYWVSEWPRRSTFEKNCKPWTLKINLWVWRCPEAKNWQREYQKIRHWMYLMLQAMSIGGFSCLFIAAISSYPVRATPH